jgi:hypothetical protein
MSTLAAWLAAMVSPLLVRAMLALGVSLVTYTGVTEGVRGLIDMAKTMYGGLPADILNLAGLAGVGEGLGIVLGALVARTALWVMSKSTQWVFSK